MNCAHKQFIGMENAVTKMQLTAPELIAARDFLRQADMLVDGVRSLFFTIGNSAPGARLKDIEGRLQGAKAQSW